MRLSSHSASGKNQSYEIRGIVEKAFQVESSGRNVFWENIGDPVQKGLHVPRWIKESVARAAFDDTSYAYCDSKGIPATRAYLAKRTNSHGGNQITPEDITFFNGLGDAIARVYGLLPLTARVLMPSPTYPAHSGAEQNRIGCKPITYSCRPDNNWLPDPEEVRGIVDQNPEICALVIINPDNPTGALWPAEVLTEMVKIADDFGLFIICDEIYENIVYRGQMTRLCQIIGNEVPAIVMKGISKEFPWPGSRCGWLEYHNKQNNKTFLELCSRIDHGKMTEVCSTTLPQRVIPEIMEHPEYIPWKKSVQVELARKMDRINRLIKAIPGFHSSEGGGAFYAVIYMDEHCAMTLPDSNILPEHRKLIDNWSSANSLPDYMLVYFLLAVYSICSVPLSSFGTNRYGFRITLLEQDTERFDALLLTLDSALRHWSGAYIGTKKHPIKTAESVL